MGTRTRFPRPTPSDYYDKLFARVLLLVGQLNFLVGELLGKAVVAAISWLWKVLDWLGNWILGAWWARLKWLSMVLMGLAILSVVAVLAGVTIVAVRSAVRACRWCWHLTRKFSSGEVTAHDVRLAAGDPQAQPLHWRGPGGKEPFSAAYIASDVKGRGENRLPNDVLVKVDGGVARLSRGQLR